MTDILPDILRKKRTRGQLIKKDVPGIVAGVASIALLGVAAATLPHDNPDEIEEGRRKQKTPEQKEAYEKLIDWQIAKYDFIVEDNEDTHLDGVVVRDKPKTNLERGDLNLSKRLQQLKPETLIKRGVYVGGNDPLHANDTQAHSTWIAFRREDGEVGFVWGGNLKQLPPKNYSK